VGYDVNATRLAIGERRCVFESVNLVLYLLSHYVIGNLKKGEGTLFPMFFALRVLYCTRPARKKCIIDTIYSFRDTYTTSRGFSNTTYIDAFYTRIQETVGLIILRTD